MKSASAKDESTVTKIDYLPWLEFLERVHPESQLLKHEETQVSESPPSVEEIHDTGVKHCHDIRELMLLAEHNQYPTWFIQPHFKEGLVRLIYEEGALTNPQGEISEIPERIEGFSGMVMHGNILNGFLSYFIGECLPSKEVIIHSQDIQFKNAVYLNDELQFNAEIIGIYDSVNAVEFKFNFKNKAAKIVAKGNIQIGLLK